MQLCKRSRVLAAALAAVAKRVPLRGMNRVLHAAFDPDRQKPYPFQAPFFEFTYFGDASNHIDWTVFFYGCYERADVDLMRSILRRLPDPTALDVGANSGHHTLAIASLCRHVHAFEPYEPVRSVLADRVARNRIGNVTIHPFGLSDSSKTLPFEPPITCNTGMGRFISTGTVQLAVRRNLAASPDPSHRGCRRRNPDA